MASTKKKTGADRIPITEANRRKRLARAVKRESRLMARTQSLIGQHVAIRMKDRAKPLVGTVLEIVDKHHDSYPHEARRHVGRYLRVRTTVGDMLASRHRIKKIKDK